MKIAVGFYGLYRTFDYTIQQWNHDIFKNHDLDFYCSTWNRSMVRGKQPNEKEAIDVTKDMILKKLPNANVSIFDEYLVGWNINNWFKWTFHVRNLLTEIKQSKIKYDLVILLRFDVILESYLTNKTEIKQDFNEVLNEKDNTVFVFNYCPNGDDGWMEKTVPYSGDFAFLGTLKNLYNIFGNRYPVPQYEYRPENNHQLFGEYLKNIEQDGWFEDIKKIKNTGFVNLIRGEDINQGIHSYYKGD